MTTGGGIYGKFYDDGTPVRSPHPLCMTCACCGDNIRGQDKFFVVKTAGGDERYCGNCAKQY